MKKKEAPIIQDNARFREALKRSMDRYGLSDNPYSDDNPERQKALKYIKDRKIKVKPLRTA